MNFYWHWWKLVTNANPTFQLHHSTRPLVDTWVLATTRQSYYVNWRSLRRVSSVFSITLTCGKWAWCRTLSSDYDREWAGCLLYENIWFWPSIRIFVSQNRGVCTDALRSDIDYNGKFGWFSFLSPLPPCFTTCLAVLHTPDVNGNVQIGMDIFLRRPPYMRYTRKWLPPQPSRCPSNEFFLRQQPTAIQPGLSILQRGW